MNENDGQGIGWGETLIEEPKEEILELVHTDPGTGWKHDELPKLQGRLNELDERISNVEDEQSNNDWNDLQERIENLEDGDFENKISDLECTNEDLESRISELEDQNSELQCQVEEVQEYIEVLKRMFSDLS